MIGHAGEVQLARAPPSGELKEHCAKEKREDWMACEYLSIAQIANNKEGGGKIGWPAVITSAVIDHSVRSLTSRCNYSCRPLHGSQRSRLRGCDLIRVLSMSTSVVSVGVCSLYQWWS